MRDVVLKSTVSSRVAADFGRDPNVEDSMFVEASELGWGPGVWGHTMYVEGVGRFCLLRFEREDGQIVAAIYRMGKLSVYVAND
jgi:hypothetical protein